MALTLINSYANTTNPNVDNIELVLTDALLGFDKTTLTHISDAVVPAIAIGSTIEINSSLLKAVTEEAISTTDPHTSATVADGLIYIFVNDTTRLAYFTATVPTWSDSKQGWYGTSSYTGYRYLNYRIYKSSTSYYKRGKINLLGFRAYMASSQSIPNIGSGAVKINFDTEEYDYNNCFDTSNKRFNPVVSGLYMITINIVINALSVGDYFYLGLTSTGSRYGSTIKTYSGTGAANQVINIIIYEYLTVGQYIEITGVTVTTPTTINGGTTCYLWAVGITN